MVQQLSKSELNDVADVMVQTRSGFLNSRNAIYFFILLSIVLGVASVSLIQLSLYVAQLCMFLSIMALAVCVYIFLYRRGLKKNVRQMIEKKVGVPLDVHVSNAYVTYNKKKYPLKKIDRVIEYNNLFYLVMGDTFMVMKRESGIDQVLDQVNYIRYKKPFNLFKS